MSLKRKRNVKLIAVIGLTAVLLITTGWSVLADIEPVGSGLYNNGWRMDGAWIINVSIGLATLNHNITFTAQDPDGLRYTTVMEHSECSATVFGMFPEATHQSNSVGIASKTGADSLDHTVLGQGIKKGELVDEVVYISVISGQMRLIDADTGACEATVAYYLATQDSDHDGLPDADQEPIISIPCNGTMHRVNLMASAEPTLQLPTQPAEAPVHEVTIEVVWLTDPWPAPDIHRNPGDAILRVGDREYQGTAVDSDYNYTYSTERSKGGFRRLVYDFGDLGMFELWERLDGEYKIIDVEGGHRHHEYEFTGWIIEGTGAFVNAGGILQSACEIDYTWEPGVIPTPGVDPIREEIHYTSNGMVRGIDLLE